jgi:hypothetical protein
VKKPKLPHTLFATWDGEDEPWINTSSDIEALAEQGKTVTVGEYRLVKIGKVALKLLVT